MPAWGSEVVARRPCLAAVGSGAGWDNRGPHVARRAQRRLGPRGLITPFVTFHGGG